MGKLSRKKLEKLKMKKKIWVVLAPNEVLVNIPNPRCKKLVTF